MKIEFDEDLLYKMREIYKTMLQEIVDTGEMRDSTVLFMKLYKEEFELIKLNKGA